MKKRIQDQQFQIDLLKNQLEVQNIMPSKAELPKKAHF